MIKKAKLVLIDGTEFTGLRAGFNGSTSGEVVFTTGMVGYEQSLTDPSYAGQILTFTYPLIGNWGVPLKKYWESNHIQVRGVIISDLTDKPSHHKSTQSLNEWLTHEKIPALYDIDTRRLTQKLRDKGVMLGKIISGNKQTNFYDPNKSNLVSQVSPGKLTVEGKGKLTVGLLNCGAKNSIKKSLLNKGVRVFDMPWNYDPFKNNLPLNGLIISNGPGDPKKPAASIQIIKKALKKKIPTFGICLGNQLLALAAGGDTYKLKFGHRAQNQPTIQVGTNKCLITTQNHGFAVSSNKIPKGFKPWFINANDNTVEGIIHEKLPFFSVQFHPEATPGPTDSEYLFDFFINKLK